MHFLTNYLEYSSMCSAFLPKKSSRKSCILLFSKHQHMWILRVHMMPETQRIQSVGVRGCFQHFFLLFCRKEFLQFSSQCLFQ